MVTKPEPQLSKQQEFACPCCGRRRNIEYSPSLREVLVNTLAVLLLVSVVVPIGAAVWNSSSHALTEKLLHFVRPL
jgi:hypothetical protein